MFSNSQWLNNLSCASEKNTMEVGEAWFGEGEMNVKCGTGMLTKMPFWNGETLGRRMMKEWPLEKGIVRRP